MRRLLGLACLWLALGGVAQAQAYQCRVANAPLSARPVAPDGPVRHMPVTGYTLALSWAPEYCKGRESRAGDRVQCSGQHGRFALVVHGLWPEGGSGRWPQWCGTPRVPSPQVLRENLCMTPSAQLMAHEWAKHGSCMTRRPETYFKVTRILWDSLRLPDLDLLSRADGLNAGMLRKAFIEANPAWKGEQIGIRLNQRGWLQEVRLCYGKDFMPKRCNSAQFGPRDSVRMKIWRGL